MCWISGFGRRTRMALWSSSSGAGLALSYWLSERGQPVVQQGRLEGPPLSLKGLRPGALYDLEVVPECPGGAEQGATAVLQFTTEEVPGDALKRFQWQPRTSGPPQSGSVSDTAGCAGPTTERLGLQGRLADHRMFLVVPWTIPSPLKDPAAESRVLLEGVIKHQLQSLLRKSWPRAEVQLISFEDYEKKTKTKIAFESSDVSSQNGVVSLLPKEQLQYFTSLNHPNITVTEEVLYWQDPDECVDSALNECGSHSLCINTLDSFTCVCQPGYYDLSPFLTPACHETGMFSRCQTGDVSGAVSKPFLLRHFGGDVTAVLNDGRCSLQETDKLYYYRMTSAPSLCGGETLLNQTHVSLRNTMTVTLSSGSSITRRDLKVLWTCAYPLLHTSTAHTQPGLAWFSSHSVVEASSSRLLQLSMGLYSDASYASSHAYAGPVELPLSARLHIQVTLHSQDSLAFQMSLQLEACWATETTDPLEERRAFYLKEGCPNDRTFPLAPPGWLASEEKDCTTNCSEGQKVKRDLPDTLTAIVSAGPISAATEELSNWTAALIILSVGGGLIGLFVLTALGVRAAQPVSTSFILLSCFSTPSQGQRLGARAKGSEGLLVLRLGGGEADSRGRDTPERSRPHSGDERVNPAA
ncbi:hypothetical protein COCON_G00232120 [Conger conger]|uniref:Uncharacterized protein n=1 Tax=Conger conger TaxID=82655 RepID=A0A9Q1CVG2_CONCO|nr:hypothetical protein COCON_G00232120 [Conger conger]